MGVAAGLMNNGVQAEGCDRGRIKQHLARVGQVLASSDAREYGASQGIKELHGRVADDEAPGRSGSYGNFQCKAGEVF